MTTFDEPLVFLPLDAAVNADPYPYFKRLRDEAPAYFAPDARMWVISRYADVKVAVHDHGTFSSQIGRLSMRSRPGQGAPHEEVRFGKTTTMLNLDPPAATRLRRLVSREFTPTAVARWTPRIQAFAEQLFDELAAANAGGSADLMKHFASPLPTMVIAEMLGIPTADRASFKRWSDELLGATFVDDDLAGKAKQANVLLQEYFDAMITEKEKNPADDLIGLYIRASHSGEEALTRGEIISHCMLLLVGGNETTTNLIGNAIIALDQFPEEYRRVQDDLSLIPQALEEALRYDSPSLGIRRATTRDVTVAGTTIPKDSMVMLMLAAANRDQRHYPDPDRFAVNRNPRDHLAFAGGPHLCIGAPLARLEASIALDTLLSRARRLRVSSEPKLHPNIYLRGRSSIPIEFTPK